MLVAARGAPGVTPSPGVVLFSNRDRKAFGRTIQPLTPGTNVAPPQFPLL
jgi:hypothetical protein